MPNMRVSQRSNVSIKCMCYEINVSHVWWLLRHTVGQHTTHNCEGNTWRCNDTGTAKACFSLKYRPLLLLIPDMSVKKLNKNRRESWSMLSLRGSNVTLRQHSWSLSLGSGRMCTATILTWKWPAEYTAVRHHTNVTRWKTTLHYKD